MTASLTSLVSALSYHAPATAKQLATMANLSESRVRELLKVVPNLETDGAKPARFWIPEVLPETIPAEEPQTLSGVPVEDLPQAFPAEPEVEDPTPEESDAHRDENAADGEPEEPISETHRTLKQGACPFCGGDPSSQTAAGIDGTFLGDSCNLCHECGTGYNRHTGEKVDLPLATKKHRKILNPQPQIDRKTKAVEEAGGTLTYASRKWTVTLNGNSKTITSREFSEFDPEELLGLVR